MNRVLGVLFAAVLVFGLGSQAMAAYTAGTLVQFVYEGETDAGYEFNTGLGSVKTGDVTNRVVTPGQMALDLSDFDTTSWEDLYVGFTTQYSVEVQVGGLPFQKDVTKNVFFATTTSDVPLVNTTYFTSLSNNASGLVNTVPTGGQLKSQSVSYWEQIENLSGTGNIQGVYAGFNAQPQLGYASLAPLADGIGSYVEMYLWQYAEFDPNTGATVRGFVDGDGNWNERYIAKLTIGIQDDGQGGAQLYTEINPVPIPGTVLLLGSGLLGLFGIRRKRG